MRRHPKPEIEGQNEQQSAKPIGHNVAGEVLKKHHHAITAAKSAVLRAQQGLKTAWDNAEKDGIDKPAMKEVIKRLEQDPATARAHMQRFTHYSTQLGLFDRIADWESAEANGANKASIDRAEADEAASAAGL